MRTMLLVTLMSIALGVANSSLAQDKCKACIDRETRECVRKVGSSPPPAAAGQPAPVQASGASYCPGEAQRNCSLMKEC